MNTKQLLAGFEQTAARYLQELEHYDGQSLTHTPSETEWSMSQMYMHLVSAAFDMQLPNIEACGRGAAPAGGTKTMTGWIVRIRGSFPPIKIKVPPSAQYTPPNVDDARLIKEQLQRLISRMREIEPTLRSIPTRSKMKHPALGDLNALIEMHFRHHLRQKARIDQFLQQSGT